MYRVLPKTSGEISAPVRAEASIVRDRLGVPHIRAANLEDALFLQGYATAQDRLWQMDALRRLAGGRLAEIIGPATVETDKEARKLRLRRVAEAAYKTLDPTVRAQMSDYARGVNYFIETHRQALPVEFTMLGYDPEPWSVVDSMLIGLHMFRDLTTSWQDDLGKEAMLAGGNRDLVEQLWPLRTGREVSPGSNAWVVSGKLTASGKPLLANDTHLAFGIPSTWYMVYLECPQLKAGGTALPGLPGVIIGHNDHIAWGVTNLQFDIQDLYIEKLDLRTGRYVFRGEARQAILEQELIPVKGQPPVMFTSWVTDHGPVWSGEDNRILSLKWVATQPGSFDLPFVQLDAAKNWEEFRAALQSYPGPAQNFVYADESGNIGYQATGRLPVRRNFNGDVPVDGSSGDYEWDGYIPFDQLPSFYNPAGGIIATANQNPFPENYPYRVHGNFASQYRSGQIRRRLSERQGWKPDEMIALEKDVYSPMLHRLAGPFAHAAATQANGDLKDAADLLRAWNGQMEKGIPAPMVASLAYQKLRQALAERAAPGKSPRYDSAMAGEVIEQLLAKRPAAWFKDWNQVLAKALADGIEEGRKSQGRNVKAWDYGVFNELDLKNPVAGQIFWVGKYFNIGPIPMSGSSSSIKQTTRRLGPSMRFIGTPGDWDQALLNLTIGESGQILSSHYKDQWNAYYAAIPIPMPWSRVEGSTLRVTPQK